MLTQSTLHTWHACQICGHAYPTSLPTHGMLARSVGMLTLPAFHHMACLLDLWAPAFHHMACLPNLWACLPRQCSTAWHACQICGHAYPTSTPPHGMLARSVGMLTPPALHHMACLPDVWACLPHQHSTTWHTCQICGHAYPASILPHGMLAGSVGMLTPPAFYHMACLLDLWACLPILPSGLNNDIEPLTHLMPIGRTYKPVSIFYLDIVHFYLVHSAFSLP